MKGWGTQVLLTCPSPKKTPSHLSQRLREAQPPALPPGILCLPNTGSKRLRKRERGSLYSRTRGGKKKKKLQPPCRRGKGILPDGEGNALQPQPPPLPLLSQNPKPQPQSLRGAGHFPQEAPCSGPEEAQEEKIKVAKCHQVRPPGQRG